MIAGVLVNLSEHLSHEHQENREQLVAFLREHGVDVRNWWDKEGGCALGINSDWVGLAFVGHEIQLSNEDDAIYQKHRAQLEEAYGWAQVYAGQVAQQQVVEAIAALGFQPENLKYDTNGVLQFEINV